MSVVSVGECGRGLLGRDADLGLDRLRDWMQTRWGFLVGWPLWSSPCYYPLSRRLPSLEAGKVDSRVSRNRPSLSSRPHRHHHRRLLRRIPGPC